VAQAAHDGETSDRAALRKPLRYAKVDEAVTIEPRQAFRRAEPNEAAGVGDDLVDGVGQ
jgi:hypothetical protein